VNIFFHVFNRFLVVPKRSPAYRPEIDGLRAVAVVAVLIAGGALAYGLGLAAAGLEDLPAAPSSYTSTLDSLTQLNLQLDWLAANGACLTQPASA
jgi:hypothetical protein